ncbi:hypothetical protein STENM327S_09082 [Streptomyces tendae]
MGGFQDRVAERGCREDRLLTLRPASLWSVRQRGGTPGRLGAGAGDLGEYSLANVESIGGGGSQSRWCDGALWRKPGGRREASGGSHSLDTGGSGSLCGPRRVVDGPTLGTEGEPRRGRLLEHCAGAGVLPFPRWRHGQRGDGPWFGHRCTARRGMGRSALVRRRALSRRGECRGVGGGVSAHTGLRPRPGHRRDAGAVRPLVPCTRRGIRTESRTGVAGRHGPAARACGVDCPICATAPMPSTGSCGPRSHERPPGA